MADVTRAETVTEVTGLKASDPAVSAGDIPRRQGVPRYILRKVVVEPSPRRVHLYLVDPFVHASSARDAEEDAADGREQAFAAACAFVRAALALEQHAVSELARFAAELVWHPANAGGRHREHVRAAALALAAVYSELVPVPGQFLRRAECTVTSARGEEGDPVSVVRFAVQNEAEREVLSREQAPAWIAHQLARLFAVDAQVDVVLVADAADRLQALRAAMEEAERREVAGIAKDLADGAARRAARQEGDASPHAERGAKRDKADDGEVRPLHLGRPIEEAPTPIHDIVDEMRRVVVEGRVFGVDKRSLPSGRTLVQFYITDETDSITAKVFAQNERQLLALEPLTEGVYVRLQGQVQFDAYAKEMVLQVYDMEPAMPPQRIDTAEHKRIELHVHTTMSALDGMTDVTEYIKQAAAWGHKAIAVTDHGVVQAFPEAFAAGKKHGVKVILGVEAYVVDDGTPIVYRMADRPLDDETEYIVFDTETTGLNARDDTLIEIAAVKMRGREIVGTFATLIDPERPISAKISELTGITSDMVAGQPKLAEALARFREFAGDAVWVAHNAEFDVGFLSQCAERVGMDRFTNPVIDTLALARVLYPGEKNYRLKTLTQKFDVELVHHHRALADAEATAKVFARMQADWQARGIRSLADLNAIASAVDVSRLRPFHATLLAQNQTGLRNLYELVSLGLTKYLHRVPRIPRSELVRLREGLLIGTACQHGELMQAFLRGKSMEELEEIARFYDFLEIQPLSHYENLVREGMVDGLHRIRDILRQVVDLGRRLNKPVAATGDVHYLHPHDKVYREVFLQAQHGPEGTWQPPLYFRTTDEMLEEFRFLGDADAFDVVVTAPNAIADAVEVVRPLPDKLYTPVIEGADEEIRRLTYEKAHALYGDPLPDIVAKRLEKELRAIIENGFAVIYLTAHKLVTKSLADGYLVGSRGSVGSSLVATMTDITEVNPLPPHYLCPSCKYSEFIEDGSVGSGFDLPDKDCPRCGTPLRRDGQDIPFETFLGFEGDKVPDIDLNFSGEYQARAHKYTEELFGKDHVFRAGTIATVAEKTAYGYVRKYAEERGLVLRNAEIERLARGCTGIKRTTGQHPGGQVVVPAHMSIYDFTPVQYPADDKEAGTLTTHLDYHSGLENCLLKLDILGHDVPTMIRMLQDLTGVDPKDIPLNDPKVLSIFRSTEALGVKPEDIRSTTGTYAIPEFGTKFVRQMLEDTRPTTFSELVRISGLSHGTDVWLNNAQDLIRNGIATLSEVICARDDIMVYLMYKGLEPSRAFKIMESIRKGKGVTEEDAAYMRQFGVPEWYIESGRKIKYMFPKAHAAAYVIMSMRLAWFKVYHPLPFYATYFTINADNFDVALAVQGRDAIWRKIEEIEAKGNAATAKEKALQTVLEVALEMVVRGFRFLPVDLYRSHATRFQVVEAEQALLPPFAAIPGVGEAAAANLYQAAQEGPFLSVEDLQSRARVTKAVVEILAGLGCLAGLPETNQLSLF
ncbi:DNA polymerase III PolC-type [Alicyclobacillus cellulosilyticus]|uniref:DNA polymerase III PolC-type n=1 Tax=Alicyclobacillus cellulosilyticus TaxID=1003997 RepID=A0A917K243_9BACL|nr:PolC-type DNA polymerase III [Alicyclobacillus cellulosilyticus]GGI94546.1 DNA polymerase III PolC-type [Alicyclobacillus cellulosilyticus]